MKHEFNAKGKSHVNENDPDSRFDRHVHMFANSAYRNAKQHGFLTGRDVLNSVESDQKFIDSLNMPSYENIIAQGRK